MICLFAKKRFGIFLIPKNWALLFDLRFRPKATEGLRPKAIEIYFLCFAFVVDRKEKPKKLKKGWGDL